MRIRDRLVLRLERFDPAFRLLEPGLANEVFHHHDITGLRNREIRFSGHDQCERLQLCRYLEAAVIAVDLQLAEVRGAPFRRDRPEHVCEVFAAVALWPIEVIKTLSLI